MYYHFIRLVSTIICFFTLSFLSANDAHEFDKIFSVHRSHMMHFSQSNPKLLIMFSGTPGMGKTTVARALEDHFKAIRISVGDVRNLLKTHGIGSHRLSEYLVWCAQKIDQTSPNHLVILDCSIDRTYDICCKHAAQWGYKTFLVRMEVERSVVEKRIELRGQNAKILLKALDTLWQDYECFTKSHQADYVYKNNDEFNGSIELKEILAPLITPYTWDKQDTKSGDHVTTCKDRHEK